MSREHRMLLLDLDGVVIFEAEPPLVEQREILRLHEGLAAALAGLNAAVVVVTHRSRTEARRILEAVGLPEAALAGLVAAEELLAAAIRQRGWVTLAQRGLLKSLILPEIERRYQLARGRLAMIDDRNSNLEDLVGCGLGLGMRAPSALGAEGKSLLTFDFREASRVFQSWDYNSRSGEIVELAVREMPIGTWHRTGISTRREGKHVFNLARYLWRTVRTSLFRARSGS